MDAKPQLFTTSMEIVPEGLDNQMVHDQVKVIDSGMQTAPDPEVDKKRREEQEHRQRRHFELTLQQARLKYPQEKLREAEEEADNYKRKWFSLAPKVHEAISTVVGHRQVNHQLMMLADEYSNFKKKANEKYIQMAQVIQRQKQKEKELQVMKGVSPYMGSLLSTLTTENMKQYNKVADHFPNVMTPTISGMSTPEQNS